MNYHGRSRQLGKEPLLVLFAELVWLEHDEKLVQGSSVRERHLVEIILQDGRPRVLADIEGLVRTVAPSPIPPPSYTESTRTECLSGVSA